VSLQKAIHLFSHSTCLQRACSIQLSSFCSNKLLDVIDVITRDLSVPQLPFREGKYVLADTIQN